MFIIIYFVASQADALSKLTFSPAVCDYILFKGECHWLQMPSSSIPSDFETTIFFSPRHSHEKKLDTVSDSQWHVRWIRKLKKSKTDP